MNSHRHSYALSSPLILSLTTRLSFSLYNNLPQDVRGDPLPLLSLMTSLFSHNKFRDAKSLLTSFITSDHPNHSLHHYLIHKDVNFPGKHPTKALLDTSIGAYVSCNHPHLALQLFKRMKKLKNRSNLLTCNTLINALVKFPSLHSIRQAHEVFTDMLEMGVKPNVNTFNLLIYGLEMVQGMERYECLPDNVTYNTLLDGLCKKGRLSEARDLLIDMKSKGLTPNRNTYNILVCGYCKMGWLKEAAKVMELMAQNNLLPDIWTYNMLLNGLCRRVLG